MRVLVLSHADVHAALDPAECESAMAEVLTARARGAAYNPLRTVLRPPGAGGMMGLMPAYGADTFALKALCLMPENPRRGLDTHQGTVTLFDGDTGIPTAILNASAVTEIRTAAVTAAATRRLARDGARVLAILGVGVQARAHLRALADVRPWEQIRIYAPTPEHARAVAAAGAGPAPGRHDLAIAAVADAAEAVAGADVVVAVTSAREPVLRHEWLAAGAHSTRSARAPRTRGSSMSRRWPHRPCSATAASRSWPRRGSSGRR